MLKIVLVLTAALISIAAHGQTYPTKPIKVLHGFAAGGPPDITLRRIATALEKKLGKPVVVENRPGASGTIAANVVAHAEPDGYTLLFGVAANLAVAPAVLDHPLYDPRTAFTPIVEVARGPYVWLVRSDLPVKSMADFIALARRSPGKMRYGTPGVASVHHLATEMLMRENGITMLHVPYGTGGVYAGILGGQIDAMFESMPSPLPYLRSGKLRALAVTGSRRVPGLPDLPTLGEQGLPDVDAHSWWGFVGPRRLPASVVDTLHREVAAVLSDPDVRQTLAQMSIEPSADTPQRFGKYIAQEYVRWRDEAKRLGIHAE